MAVRLPVVIVAGQPQQLQSGDTMSVTLTGDVTCSGSVATLANVPNTATFAAPDLTAVPNDTGGWTEYFVTTNPATTTGQSLTPITGLVTGTLSNSVKYEIEATLDVSTSADINGIKYGITAGGGGTAAVVSVMCNCSSTSATVAAAFRLSTIDTANANAVLTTSSQTGTLTMQGFVTTRSTGTATISLEHLKVSSGTSTVAVGSVFRIRKAHT